MSSESAPSHLGHRFRSEGSSVGIVTTAIHVLLLAGVNLLIAGRLFNVEYSAHLDSIEGTFIAIARQMAQHGSESLWWPLWDCGLPIQNTYLPLLPILTAAYAKLSGVSAALSYHRVAALAYGMAPIAIYAMGRVLSRRPQSSLIAALMFSLISPCAWLIPNIRRDLGSVWGVRRLQILVYYGEGPHTLSFVFIPLAILFLYLSIRRDALRFRILAGICLGLAVLANAFAAVILGIAAVALLMTIRTERIWSNLLVLALVGGLAYAWISPFLPPSVVAAIRMNSPTADGDYRFTGASLLGVFLLAGAGAATLYLTKRTPEYLRFFALFTIGVSGIVLLGTLTRINVVPQPHRYQIAMDMGLCLTATFALAAVLERSGKRATQVWAFAATVFFCFGVFLHDWKYARRLIRPVDITTTTPYRIADWSRRHMDGRRMMVSGSYSFHFNVFTDTPQLHGGHDPMLPNFLIRIATFIIYSGMNAGARDAEVSKLWLQALGAHAISVPGPRSSEYYKPFVNPRKFDGVLPVLWQEGDDTIYGVPAASGSLAHIVPDPSLVHTAPVNGLDIAELTRYVAAINDRSVPQAHSTWRSPRRMEIRSGPNEGKAVSVQVSYHPGWRARVGDRELSVASDGLGFLTLWPQCRDACTITMDFDGGRELLLTGIASAAAILIALAPMIIALVRRRMAHGSHSAMLLL